MCYCDNDSRKIAQLKQRVASWITAYSKECSKHKQKRMDDYLNSHVTADQLQQFKTSKVCLTAVKLIGLMSTEDHSMSQARVRDSNKFPHGNNCIYIYTGRV